MIAKVGLLFTVDQKASSILASVSLVQFILESGYGKSELASAGRFCVIKLLFGRRGVILKKAL